MGKKKVTSPGFGKLKFWFWHLYDVYFEGKLSGLAYKRLPKIANNWPARASQTVLKRTIFKFKNFLVTNTRILKILKRGSR